MKQITNKLGTYLPFTKKAAEAVPTNNYMSKLQAINPFAKATVPSSSYKPNLNALYGKLENLKNYKPNMDGALNAVSNKIEGIKNYKPNMDGAWNAVSNKIESIKNYRPNMDGAWNAVSNKIESIKNYKPNINMEPVNAFLKSSSDKLKKAKTDISCYVKKNADNINNQSAVAIAISGAFIFCVNMLSFFAWEKCVDLTKCRNYKGYTPLNKSTTQLDVNTGFYYEELPNSKEQKNLKSLVEGLNQDNNNIKQEDIIIITS